MIITFLDEESNNQIQIIPNKSKIESDNMSFNEKDLVLFTSKEKLFLKVVDYAFCLFVVAPAVISLWRAIWMEMDLHKDYFPIAQSFFLGGALHWGFTMTRDIQKTFFVQRSKTIRHQFESFVYRRLYTYCFFIATILHWRSGWLILDSLNDYFQNKNANVIAGGICWILLMVFRSTRNVIAIPLVIALDTEKLSFVYPTRFKTESCQKNRPAYVLDCLFSVFVIGTLVVFVWRGAWVLLDIYLYPDEEGASAIGSVVLGYVVTISAFLIQPLMKWVCEKTTGLLRLCIADIYLLFAFIGTVNVWRGLWNVLNLYYLPDDPELSCWSTHTIFLILLILLKCSNSVLVRGVYIDAEEPAGKCVVFPCYYLRLYFQNERIKKHCVQLQSLRRKSDISCGDFTKIKPMQHETTAHLCTCHMTNESVTNHITVNIPLMNPIKECNINDNHDATL